MNGIRSGIVALALTAAFAGTAAAQAGRGLPDVFTLVGPGSAIGVTVRDVTPADAEKAKLAQPAGVYVESVRESSPAAKAGLAAGDIVLDFDGERVRSVRQFTRLVQDTPPGRQVATVVMRGTARQTMQVVPEASNDFRAALPELRGRVERLPRDFNLNIQPRLNEVLPRLQSRLNRPVLGVSVTPVSDQLAQYFGVKEGAALVMSVVSDSPAAAAGLKAGDVITQVNGRAVSGANDVSEAFRSAAAGAAVEIRIVRDRKEMTLKATRPAVEPAPAPRGIRFEGAGVRL